MNIMLSLNSINFVSSYLPENSTILEFGSGQGTKILLKKHNVISIEHDPNWMNIKHPNHKYLHFELDSNHWYKGFTLPDSLYYDLIIIDGPPAYKKSKKYARLGIMSEIEKLRKVPILIDDTNRVKERLLKNKLIEKLNYKNCIEISGNYKTAHFLS